MNKIVEHLYLGTVDLWTVPKLLTTNNIKCVISIGKDQHYKKTDQGIKYIMFDYELIVERINDYFLEIDKLIEFFIQKKENVLLYCDTGNISALFAILYICMHTDNINYSIAFDMVNKKHKCSIDPKLKDRLINFYNIQDDVKNLKSLYGDEFDTDGYTADIVDESLVVLHICAINAIECDNVSILTKLVLDKKITLDRDDNIYLKSALQYNSIESINFLLKHPEVVLKMNQNLNKDASFLEDDSIKEPVAYMLELPGNRSNDELGITTYLPIKRCSYSSVQLLIPYITLNLKTSETLLKLTSLNGDYVNFNKISNVYYSLHT